MNDSEFFNATPELRTIYQWARARYAAPWAVLFAVLLRVAASTSPTVQLPGVIGGRSSLNLLCAFVGPSGTGKGTSDKVGRLAWPDDTITELPIGSGEGIAATYTASDDADRITKAIFNCSEIDILTGIAARQGSTILGTLKAFAMGEALGATNATKANSRNVPAHTYRGCLSVGAQPGHTGVIFADTSGGTPQRFLWAPVTDPDMPAERTPDPEPLNHHLPPWTHSRETVVEVTYGPDEIPQTIIDAHLARQRGEGDALNGHWMLTRCKVAAVIAVMHHRSVVSQLDWELSATVMAVSDRTRQWLLDEAKRAEKERTRARAAGRAEFDEQIDERHAQTAWRRIKAVLGDRAMPRSELRRAMGKQHYREAFDSLLPRLESDGIIIAIPGSRAMHYQLAQEFTGEPQFTPQKPSSNGVNHEFTSEPHHGNLENENSRSQRFGQSGRVTNHGLATTAQEGDEPAMKTPQNSPQRVCAQCNLQLHKSTESDLCDDCREGARNAIDDRRPANDDRQGRLAMWPPRWPVDAQPA